MTEEELILGIQLANKLSEIWNKFCPDDKELKWAIFKIRDKFSTEKNKIIREHEEQNKNSSNSNS